MKYNYGFLSFSLNKNDEESVKIIKDLLNKLGEGYEIVKSHSFEFNGIPSLAVFIRKPIT